MMVKSSVLGYPRIGADREWKKALEAYLVRKIKEAELHATLRDIRLANLRKQHERGHRSDPRGRFQLLRSGAGSWPAMFGIVPKRFGLGAAGAVPLAVYYGIARGTAEATACEMTKWFNTNYHYIVPELANGAFPC